MSDSWTEHAASEALGSASALSDEGAANAYQLICSFTPIWLSRRRSLNRPR